MSISAQIPTLSPRTNLAVGLLAGLAIAWCFSAGANFAPVQAQAPSGSGSVSEQTFAFLADGPSDSQRLIVVDGARQAFAVYRVSDSAGSTPTQIKLEAVRQCRWDLQLKEYNNASPKVGDIEDAVNRLDGVRR